MTNVINVTNIYKREKLDKREKGDKCDKHDKRDKQDKCDKCDKCDKFLDQLLWLPLVVKIMSNKFQLHSMFRSGVNTSVFIRKLENVEGS